MPNRRRPGSSGEEGGMESAGMMRWLLTYADLITLLLAFFVVLYGASQVDANRWQQLSQALRSAFNQDGAAGGVSLIAENPGASAVELIQPTDDNQQFAEIVEKIEAYVKEKGLEASISQSITQRGLVIGLADNLLFETGKADLTVNAQKILDKVAGILLKVPNHVRVEGHSDNVPIRTARYPSNWQLSTDRATNVIMYWTETYSFPPERLSAAGYGEYRPVVPNDSIEHRAKNRRVDIVVLKMALTGLEPKAYDKGGDVSKQDGVSKQESGKKQ